MSTEKNREKLTEAFQRERRWIRRQEEILSACRRFIESLDLKIVQIMEKDEKPEICVLQSQVNLTVKGRDVAQELRAFFCECYPAPDKRTWARDVGDNERLVYSNTFFEGNFTVNIEVDELPPSCEIVEEEEFVPAQEAYTRTVKKVRCKTPEALETVQ